MSLESGGKPECGDDRSGEDKERCLGIGIKEVVSIKLFTEFTELGVTQLNKF
ncbi:MAG TPA: hypothetical protein VGZ69_06860 [Candidatus Rhabdochlamydia sp.]|nr:hypothetical protein [Candidatus Rhabdochlamydia sp.]